jgi:hypothetical protein
LAKKEEKKVPEHNHTGSVVPEDEELTKHLNRLWARNEPPERVEVWQVFGKEKRDRGDMIFHQDFSPGTKLDIEKANHLANEIIAAAQNDCDATPKRREAYFQIAIIDKNRRAVPLVRRLGPLRPQRNVALVRDGEIDAETDEEEMSIRTLEHARLKTGFEELRWGTNRNDRVLGELLMLMGSIIQEQRDETRVLRTEVREERRARDEAEDRRAQREMMLEEKRFSIGLKKEALRVGRNLIPGLFSEARETPQIANGHSNGNGQTQPDQPQYGASTERALVDNFLTDIEGEEGLEEKLFGEAEEKNGEIVVTRTGIFTPKQASILIGVRRGFLPPDALDPLMPESGHKISITMEQIQQAMEAGITDGMGMSLMELKDVRKRAREKKTGTAAPTQPKTPDDAHTFTT